MVNYPTRAVRSEAIFEANDTHRVWLERHFVDKPERAVHFCMCNPSTATAEHNDATLFKIETYTLRWGFDSFFITNAFSIRSRDPQVMKKAAEPALAINDEYIRKGFTNSELTVFGFSEHVFHRGRIYELAELFKELQAEYPDIMPPTALKVNKSGAPAHPVYLGSALLPQPYIFPAR